MNYNDYEGRMAKENVYKLHKYSKDLFEMLDDHVELESWVQSKITKAADYISSVKHYLEYEMEFGPDEPLYKKGDIRVVKGGYSYGPEKPGKDGVKFILISNGGPVDLNWSDITPPPR